MFEKEKTFPQGAVS